MRVFIAGPLLHGDTAVNVRIATMAADQLIRRGHAAFVPHLHHFWHMMYPHQEATWLWHSYEWLKVCGAVIRLKGESVGADQEVAWAVSKQIPVFDSVDQFLIWHDKTFPVNTTPKALTQRLDANTSPGTWQSQGEDNDRRRGPSQERGPRG